MFILALILLEAFKKHKKVHDILTVFKGQGDATFFYFGRPEIASIMTEVMPHPWISLLKGRCNTCSRSS